MHFCHTKKCMWTKTRCIRWPSGVWLINIKMVEWYIEELAICHNVSQFAATNLQPRGGNYIARISVHYTVTIWEVNLGT